MTEVKESSNGYTKLLDHAKREVDRVFRMLEDVSTECVKHGIYHAEFQLESLELENLYDSSWLRDAPDDWWEHLIVDTVASLHNISLVEEKLAREIGNYIEERIKEKNFGTRLEFPTYSVWFTA